MRRRDFIKAIAGSAAVWPLTVRAQQGDRTRRLGIIIGPAGEESETKERITAFLQELKHLGWAEGRNVQIERRESAALDMTSIAAVHESACGLSRHFVASLNLVAIGGIADIGCRWNWTPR